MEFKSWLQSKEKPPKVIWFTGMNSSGSKPKQLALLGYDVQGIGTTNHYFAAYLGRIKRYHPFKAIGKITNQWGVKHIDDNIQGHFEKIEKDFKPDVVVGTSQGGAIAMKLGNVYPNSKFVLGCPAWKIFDSEPVNLPKDTIVVHGRKDIVVPIGDSAELVEKYDFKFRIVNSGHSLPFYELKKAIDDQLKSLGINIPLPITVQKMMSDQK